MKQVLIGYAVRHTRLDVDWDENRRAEFLLRPDVALPKSVDSSVWEDAVPNWVDAIGGFKVPLTHWGDRNAMRAAAGDALQAGAVEAALTIFGEEACIPDWIATGFVEPNPLPANEYRLLGYDVADENLLSGLSNCSYTESDITRSRKNFAAALNDHGLFSDFAVAQTFATWSDERVEEHAPFFVCGVYVRS